MKNVMSRAWEIYRGYTSGIHREKISAALKAAWTEYKSGKSAESEGEFHGSAEYGYFSDTAIDELVDLGMNRWTKYGKDRLYMNEEALEKMGGLETDTYKSGHIRFAAVNGDKISNSEAGSIIAGFTRAYIDLTTGAMMNFPEAKMTNLVTAKDKVFTAIRAEINKRRTGKKAG